MQAIVLVGGEGTRLRPLTETVPKPALTAGRPALPRLHDRVAGAATASPRSCSPAASCPTCCAGAAGEEERAGVADPLRGRAASRCGTAGAIRFAADELGDELEDRFLALNGDVLTDLDLSALLGAHEERRARATIGLHPVEDSSAYGLVARRPGRRGSRVPREDRRARCRARSTPACTCWSARCST